MMNKKFTTHYAALSKLILSMSQEQQKKMLDLGFALSNDADFINNKGVNINNVILASCTFTGIVFISIFTILMFILT